MVLQVCVCAGGIGVGGGGGNTAWSEDVHV